MPLYIFIAAFIVLVDQLVKAWAVTSLKAVGIIPVIRGVFQFTYSENTGAAFGILSGFKWLFFVIGAIAIAVLVYSAVKGPFTARLPRVAVSTIIGGILGNLIDRAWRGFVVDMFEPKFIRFAIFNVADFALTVGVGLLIIFILASGKEGTGEQQDDNGG